MSGFSVFGSNVYELLLIVEEITASFRTQVDRLVRGHEVLLNRFRQLRNPDIVLFWYKKLEIIKYREGIVNPFG